MKHYLLKTLIVLRNVLIALIVLLAIIQGIARVLSPSVDRYRPQIEAWLAEKLHQPVTINQMTATWRGFHPVITFNKVTVFNKEKTAAVLNINQLRLSVGVIKSLWHRRLEPSMFSLTGTHLVVHQLGGGDYDVNGTLWHIPVTQDQDDKNSAEKFFNWLSKQGQIQLDQVSLDWHGSNGLVLPISNLKLKLTDGFFRRSLMGVVKLGTTNNPPRLRFVINIHRNLFRTGAPEADFFIHSKNIDVSQWLSARMWHQIKIQAGLMTDLRVWGEWKDNQFNNIQTIFHLNSLQLSSTLNKKAINYDQITANLYWQHKEGSWKLSGNLHNYIVDKTLRPAFEFVVSSKLTEKLTKKVVLQLSSLSIGDILDLLKSSDLISNVQQRELLEKLDPTGNILQTGIVAEINPENKWLNYTVTGKVQPLNWRAVNKIPGARNVTGDFCITRDWAWFNINSQNVFLDASGLFKHAFALNLMQTNLVWQKTTNGWEVSAHDFYLEDPVAAIRGDMKYLAFDDKSSPIFSLLANFSQSNPQKIVQYLPQAIFPEKFDRWMGQAFQSGGQVTGSVLVQGPIRSFPFDNKDGKFQMILYPHQLNFSFAPNWPVMENVLGEIKIDGRRMDIQLTSANVLNFPLQNAIATIENMSKPVLVIHTQTQGTFDDAKRLINQSPLKKNFGRSLEPLEILGKMQMDLQLTIPMNSTPPPPATLLGNLIIQPGAQLRVTSGNLLFKNLQGKIQFTQNTITADNIKASFYDQPVNIGINTTQGANKRSTTNITLSGKMPLSQLNKQFPGKFENDFISGVFPYNATLSVKTGEYPSQVSLKILSDLTGISLNLPPPWQKTAAEKKDFSLDVDLSQSNKIKILANYNKQLSGVFNLSQVNKQWGFDGGEIRFGSQPASFANTQGGFVVKGDLGSVNWADIANYISSMTKKNTQQPSKTSKTNISNLLRLIDINVANLNFYSVVINKAHLQIQPKEGGGWSVRIDSPSIAGTVDIPANYPRGTLRADFDRLHLVTTTSESKTHMNPGTLPAIYFTSRDFSYMDKHFGSILLQTSPQHNALSIDKLVVNQPAMTLYATGSWSAGGRGDQTILNGYITSTNLGNFLKNLNMTNSLVGGTGRMVFQLSWAAPAYSPKLSVLNGHVEIDFRNGRIINISQGAEAGLGLGRVLNLFSLQTLPRRLSLNFSDLTESGFSFDVMSGEFNLQNGHAVTQKFSINGPIAKVEVSGRIGLASKDYDLNMLVTPYVTSSLPVIATIAGGPVAGAVTWAANKVFGSTVSKISSQSYHITGSWAEPNVSDLPAPNYQGR